MKILTLSLFLAVLGFTTHAQVRPKTKDYMEDKAKGSMRIHAINTLNKDSSNMVLIIVDDKIYNVNSDAFKSIPTESLELLRTIQDSVSNTPVKLILIYRRK